MQRFIAVITFAIVFSSCINRSKSDLAVFSAAEEGLEQSSKTVSYSTQIYYMGIEKKLAEPSTATIASVWKPRAMSIKEKTTEIVNYIELLTDKLRKGIGAIDQKVGEELYQKLIRYRDDILTVHPRINEQFGKSSVIITQAFELDSSKEKNFTQTFFNDIPAIAALAMLSKFKNNIRILENEFVGYCYNNIGTMGWRMDIYTPLVKQSSNQLKAGDKIEILAGIGAYASQANAKITINGKIFQLDASEGFTRYKFKTPLKKGKYYVPVKFEYTDDIGRRQVVIEKVEYTVIE